MDILLYSNIINMVNQNNKLYIVLHIIEEANNHGTQEYYFGYIFILI